MLALLRLAGFSFLFGAVLLAVIAAGRSAVALFLPLPPDFPTVWREKLPGWSKMVQVASVRVEKRGFYAFRFLSDLFCSLFVAISFVLFLFWQADGIPRFFVFLFAFFGGMAAYKLFNKPYLRLHHMVLFVGRFLFLSLLVPMSMLFSKVGRGFLLFFGMVGLFFIKRLKRQYTKHKANHYSKVALSAIGGRKMRSRMLDALRKGQEGEAGAQYRRGSLLFP